MEIMKPLKFDRIAYRCQCATCETKVEVNKADLHYGGGLSLYWICPICCLQQNESIFKINSKKVVYYKEVEEEK